MDFFAQQDRSRNRTFYLVLLFMVSVVLTVLGVYFAIRLLVWNELPHGPNGGFVWMDTKMLLIVLLATLLVVGVSGLVKILQLNKGGGYVAESLGGRRIEKTTIDRHEKRVLNVVIEMAIASGIPVPQVYLLDHETGINAFAAGYTASDAVVAVTHGTIEKLNRDELQGVVAHEFSHILNGDMRLNIRLIGFLYGIMVISFIGKGLLQGISKGGGRGKGSGVVMLLGLALMIIGFIGHFFGQMIQCGICRQREFLADASAVQFTRNPGGISGALKKIGGFVNGSQIISSKAGEVSHLFFSMAINSMFSTHPPLDERIRRIEPGFKGSYDEMGRLVPNYATGGFDPSVSVMNISAGHARQTVGNMTPEQIQYSTELLGAIPDKIKNELKDMFGATALILALLMDKDEDVRNRQINALKKTIAPEMRDASIKLEKDARSLQPVLKLTVIHLAIQTLRSLSAKQYAELTHNMQVLMAADGKLNLFEFVVNKLIGHHLGVVFNSRKQKTMIKSMDKVLPHAVMLLSLLAKSGHLNAEAARKAFAFGNQQLKYAGIQNPMGYQDKVAFKDLDRAFDILAIASPGIKRAVFDACCDCVLFDGKVAVREAELLRATASIMDIPVPPFINTL